MLQSRLQLVQHRGAQIEWQINTSSKVAFDTRVSAMRAEMHKIRQRLHARRAFVKVRALATKGIGRNDRLGTKCMLADGTGQFDEIQCRHGLVGAPDVRVLSLDTSPSRVECMRAPSCDVRESPLSYRVFFGEYGRAGLPHPGR